MTERAVAPASHLASRMVPNRRHPYGSGWGGGYLNWPQREGFEIRAEVERATRDAILKILDGQDA